MDSPSVQAPAARKQLLDARGRPYQPAVGPRLRVLLFLIFAATALLGITGVYLVSIRVLETVRAPQTYTNAFTLWMFFAHILVGVLIALPFFVFGIAHYRTARHRKNRLAVKLGLALFAAGVVVVLSGLALVQLAGLPQLPVGVTRWVVYGLHVAAPAAAVLLYVLHRRAGPDIEWRWAYAWGTAVAGFVLVMIVLHLQDPRKLFAKGPREGEKYYHPSAARTSTGNFIPAKALMMDEYCMKCHPDIYKDHYHSAHHFSSFNNPPYRFSVRESRKIRDDKGVPRASRWCAGCHDPVPFFSGAFDDPKFDDVNDPTAHAGITCTVCHAITNVNSTVGNADYTIEEPEHYPFAYSDNGVLQWINNQLVKAKPDFHKKTFLKPFHKTAEFCSTCHKVSLPVELNHYKEFLRGQDHYNSYLLSGVSGHGARSFYYPPKAQTNCNGCHMPTRPSLDFGSKDFDTTGERKVHNHLFPGANTGLPSLLSLEERYAPHAATFREVVKKETDFLTGTAPEGKDRSLRVDLFALKQGGSVDAPVIGPLRPALPALQPGQTYLVEVVIRTVAMGHPFTQGTADSNEVWVDFAARSGGRVLGRSGALADEKDDSGPLDEWAHRINILMLDRHGNRINRRNPEDIFTPLYNHQIPPGAAQVVHYRIKVPEDVKAPVELSVRVRYRKFDYEYMEIVYGKGKVPKLPVVDLCSDRVDLPVKGVAAEVPRQTSPIKPAWQRWNDYGIGCLLEGGPDDKKGELRQAAEAFQELLKLDEAAHVHGHINLARVYIKQGLFGEAARALNAAREDRGENKPWWTIAWFNGLVNLEHAQDFDAAVKDFESILDPKNQPRDRGFDFSLDYVVINKLALTYFNRAQLEGGDPAARDPFLLRAVELYGRTLQLDPEDLDAHYGLHQCYRILARAVPKVLANDASTPPTDEAGLVALGKVVRNDKVAKTARLEAAARLAWGVNALREEPVSAEHPKRARVDVLLGQMRPYFDQEKDPELRAAAAEVLSALHREAHAIFKPDDIAGSFTAQKYRATHPAADRAAEAIVIYDLR